VRSALLLSLTWLLSVPGLADEARPLADGATLRADGARLLAYDLRVDVPLTVVGAGLWLTSSLLQDSLVPAQCRWCDDNAFDRRARDALRWSDPAPAGTLSDVLVACAIPAVSLGGLALARLVDRVSMREAWLDALFVVEATAWRWC